MAEALTRQFSDRLGGVDSQLLAGQEMARARREQQGSAANNTRPGANATGFKDIPETGPAKNYVSGREKTNREKLAQQGRILKKVAEKKGAQVAAKEGSKWLLRTSWLSATTGIGVVILVAVANIIVFLRWVFGPESFPRLGEEWTPGQLKKLTGGAGEMASRGIGLVEVMGLIIIDAAVFALFATALALLVIIITFMSKSWLGQIWAMMEVVWNLGFEGLSVLVSFFSGTL